MKATLTHSWVNSAVIINRSPRVRAEKSLLTLSRKSQREGSCLSSSITFNISVLTGHNTGLVSTQKNSYIKSKCYTLAFKILHIAFDK